MGLPQHWGGFSTLRLTSPVQEISYSVRNFYPHFLHWKIGINENWCLLIILVFLVKWRKGLGVFSERVVAACAS